MAKLLRICVVLFVFSVVKAVDLTPNFSNEARSCELYCTEVNAGEAAKACSRGCRFFTISSYLRPSGDVRGFCSSSCVEAYGEESELFAPCDEGCEQQFRMTPAKKSPTIRLPLAPQDAGEPEEGEMHLATPIMQVRRIVARVVGSFHILKKSVLTYFLRDDNKIMAVESAPEVVIEMVPTGQDGEKGFKSFSGVLRGEDLKPEPEESPEQLLANNKEFSFSLNGLNPFSSSSNQASPEGLTGEESEAAEVRVVSLRRGRYAYLLHLLLVLAAALLSLFALVYCIAAARHQKRQAVKQANLSVALQSEPLKLVRPEDLTKLSLMEEDQAPPLPQKQDLAFTHANV